MVLSTPRPSSLLCWTGAGTTADRQVTDFPAVAPGRARFPDPNRGLMLPVEGFLTGPPRHGEWAHDKQPASSPCRASGMGVAGTPVAEKKWVAGHCTKGKGEFSFPCRSTGRMSSHCPQRLGGGQGTGDFQACRHCVQPCTWITLKLVSLPKHHSGRLSPNAAVRSPPGLLCEALDPR